MKFSELKTSNGRMILLPFLWSIMSLGACQSLDGFLLPGLMCVALTILLTWQIVGCICVSKVGSKLSTDKWYVMYLLVSNMAFMVLSVLWVNGSEDFIILLTSSCLLNVFMVYKLK